MTRKAEKKYTVGTVDEIPPGERKIVDIDGRSIGVFNVDGKFFALLNRCPHQAAPLCEGKVIRSTLPSKPGEYRLRDKADVVTCPWHGWEFHIPSGESVFDPFRCKVRTYEVTVERGGISGSLSSSRSERDGAESDQNNIRFIAEDDGNEWPRAETFPVTVESDQIVLHLSRRGKGTT